MSFFIYLYQLQIEKYIFICTWSTVYRCSGCVFDVLW